MHDYIHGQLYYICNFCRILYTSVIIRTLALAQYEHTLYNCVYQLIYQTNTTKSSEYIARVEG